ncbi:MAG TPA: GreA/GreB family elongation factor [Chitinophagaceae bacterium]
MRITTEAPILSKLDYGILMQYLSGGQAKSLYNRFNVEELLAEIKRANLVDHDQLPEDVVRLNSTVRVHDKDEDKVIELTLVAPKLANIKEKKISVMSPVGIALIGSRKGQRVGWRVPLGEKHFTILEVWHNT